MCSVICVISIGLLSPPDYSMCLNITARVGLCRVVHPGTGRVLEVSTTQPGVQFYTSNFLDGTLKGKGGAAYSKHSAFCLETQNWPDAVNQVNELIKSTF